MVGMTVEQVRIACIAMYCCGASIADVARFMKVTPYIVGAAVARLVDTGTVADKPRSGRPPGHTKRDEREVKYHVMRNATFSARRLALEKHLPQRFVGGVLRSSGFRRFADRNLPFVTELWKRKRRELYNNLERYDWANIIYSDEKSFQFEPDGRVKIYARSTDEFMQHRENVGFGDRISVKVWGAISSRGTSQLIFLENPWNTEAYINQVLAVIFASEDSLRMLLHSRRYIPHHWFFQQDNDSRHKTQAAMNFLRAHRVKLVKWPPRSPDWSPIENIWSIITRKIREEQLRANARWTKDDLKEAILRAWNSITPEVCKRLCYSVPSRIRASRKHGWMPK